MIGWLRFIRWSAPLDPPATARRPILALNAGRNARCSRGRGAAGRFHFAGAPSLLRGLFRTPLVSEDKLVLVGRLERENAMILETGALNGAVAMPRPPAVGRLRRAGDAGIDPPWPARL